MKQKAWNIINSNIFSNVAGAVAAAGLTWQFSRSYREGELKDLKNDLTLSEEDRMRLAKTVKDFESVNQRLVSELTMKQSQLSDCRDNFRDSYCFWRKDTRGNCEQLPQQGKAPSTQIGRKDL